MTVVPVRPDHDGEPADDEAAGTGVATDDQAHDTTNAPDDDTATTAADASGATDAEGSQTMSWWQDGDTDDRPTADETAVAAVTSLAETHLPALVVQGLLLTGSRPAAEDIAYEAFGRLRRDWFRLPDADHALAYLRGAVTTLAREHPMAPAGPTSTAETDASTTAETDAIAASDGDGADDGGDPTPVDTRRALATVAQDEREALVVRHHLLLPASEAALCLCTSVAPLQALLSGGLGQLRTVLGPAVEGYDDDRLAALVASAGSDVVPVLDRARLDDALKGGARRLAVVPRRRRRADAAWVLLGVLVGGAVAAGAVWRSHSSSDTKVAAIRNVSVTTIVGGGKLVTTTAATPLTAAPTTVATTVAPTTTTTVAPTTVASDVLAATVTPAPTAAPIPSATTRGTAPRSPGTTAPGSATTAQTAPPVPTASPTTAPAPATTPAPTTAATAPPTAPPTTPTRSFSLGLYGCARSDSSFFVNGTADPASGAVVVSGNGFSFTSAISPSGTWRVAGTVPGAAQGSVPFTYATTGRGGRNSTTAACSA